jgi:hypothetical protein
VVRLRFHGKVHSKFILIQPDIVILGSANLHFSTWHDTCMLIRSIRAYRWFLAEWKTLWNESEELKSPKRRVGFGFLPLTYSGRRRHKRRVT